jgi:undecaprenol kinase
MRQFGRSLGHAARGVKQTWRHERNFRIQVVTGVVVALAAWGLHFGALRFAVLAVVVGLVLACELLNTALEEMWGKAGVSEEVGRSKDAAAGAVLVVAGTAVVVGLALFIEPIARALGHG